MTADKADDERVAGYRAGFDRSTSAAIVHGRSSSFRHGFAVGRMDRDKIVFAPMTILQAMAAAASRADAEGDKRYLHWVDASSWFAFYMSLGDGALPSNKRH